MPLLFFAMQPLQPMMGATTCGQESQASGGTRCWDISLGRDAWFLSVEEAVTN